MSEEHISPEFRLKDIDETRNYLIEEINQNKLMSKKHQKFCTTLNHIEHVPILATIITECGSISIFASSVTISNSYRNHEFRNRIKNLCNNFRN